MAKDPAFLFYYQDFLVGTSFMTNEQKGAYITLLCHQADGTVLTDTVIHSVCRNDELWKSIEDKFTFEEDYWYNEKLADVMIKRAAFSASRRQNRLGKTKKEVKNTRKSSVSHMEDENENEIVIKKEDKKRRSFIIPTAEEVEIYISEYAFGGALDANKFIDFYESKGWMIGKNKMKSWRAAVRTWLRQSNTSGGSPLKRGEPPPSPDLESQLKG